jgi:hypothetical protein
MGIAVARDAAILAADAVFMEEAQRPTHDL